jgi:hypothetical protein
MPHQFLFKIEKKVSAGEKRKQVRLTKGGKREVEKASLVICSERKNFERREKRKLSFSFGDSSKKATASTSSSPCALVV